MRVWNLVWNTTIAKAVLQLEAEAVLQMKMVVQIEVVLMRVWNPVGNTTIAEAVLQLVAEAVLQLEAEAVLQMKMVVQMEVVLMRVLNPVGNTTIAEAVLQLEAEAVLQMGVWNPVGNTSVMKIRWFQTTLFEALRLSAQLTAFCHSVLPTAPCPQKQYSTAEISEKMRGVYNSFHFHADDIEKLLPLSNRMFDELREALGREVILQDSIDRYFTLSVKTFMESGLDLLTLQRKLLENPEP